MTGFAPVAYGWKMPGVIHGSITNRPPTTASAVRVWCSRTVDAPDHELVEVPRLIQRRHVGAGLSSIVERRRRERACE